MTPFGMSFNTPIRNLIPTPKLTEFPKFTRVHGQAKFAQSTFLCFQYLRFHDHTFTRAKLANYVIVPDSTDSSNKCLAVRTASVFVSWSELLSHSLCAALLRSAETWSTCLVTIIEPSLTTKKKLGLASSRPCTARLCE